MGNAVSFVGDRSSLFELVRNTYEAAHDETLRPAIGLRIAEAFGAMSGALRVQDPLGQNSGFLSLTEQDSAKSIESWEAYYELRRVALSRK
jgi:hypothetical protein